MTKFRAAVSVRVGAAFVKDAGIRVEWARPIEE
jgi:hypothetical protein